MQLYRFPLQKKLETQCGQIAGDRGLKRIKTHRAKNKSKANETDKRLL
jgi:hypothetical protein